MFWKKQPIAPKDMIDSYHDSVKHEIQRERDSWEYEKKQWEKEREQWEEKKNTMLLNEIKERGWKVTINPVEKNKETL